jgi:hypothetical protein
MAWMYLSIFESGEPGAAEGLSIDPASLYRAFEQVTDARPIELADAVSHQFHREFGVGSL